MGSVSPLGTDTYRRGDLVWHSRRQRIAIFFCYGVPSSTFLAYDRTLTTLYMEGAEWVIAVDKIHLLRSVEEGA